ncbi:protein Aster-B-like isoform X1 [Biomphalaria glabrata]|uniref:Protein Aster-B-like isoform X1 n=1 Tax=Biomphalaria glabrata TaxID=6526 RepID=A0A9W2YRJ1_BIOGL|nr:protein Aster-B-like isoform X1 [Biomphalaria glabrata]XP_013075666.2 protein Aster-B-like isoform X1 [Biomphalaria glabrata]XP_055865371.1 protein Aster-B-like isoform X1 [Biomphalaria glabrata]XP_055865372.1 protein Aster-B-like isoform X1 [Biomphalaria glabrata]XP_055865373.1 protein Aster-B-like isoform X1 [Biomphalaria glabrata]XP_055865374.1 protein Aster-B-like isoform X1 [Biomphalaria glabrata]XP_055865375.1 protein Aster-B-like isoform X1 [Biomphalaria glabrata]XP_055865376.1 pro
MNMTDGDISSVNIARNELNFSFEGDTNCNVINFKPNKDTLEMQRVSLTVDQVEYKRFSGVTLRETKQKQTDAVSFDVKMSPNLSVYHRRRSKDLNSSQESLSSPGLQRPSSRASSTDLRESDEGAKEGGSPIHNSANCSRSASPDKPHNTYESPPRINTISEGMDRSFTENGNALERRPGSAQDLYEMNSSNRSSYSFERSLDNILDKCSEKSLDISLAVDSWNSSAQEGGKSPDQQSSGSIAKSGSKTEKKKNRWYNSEMDKRKSQMGFSKKSIKRKKQIMSTTYKSRSEDYKRMFKDVPKDERLIVDYSCALQKDILVQGRMYISQKWICFYAKIFNWETMLMIPCKEITAITKEKTARVIPNAIQITTEKERFFFTSFGTRDKTYMMLFRIWQNALLDQPMSAKELWTWIHYNYGDDLGLTTDDEDYVPPQSFEELTEKLKEEIPAIKELNTDSEVLTTTAENLQTASNEDTDAFVTDEVFNNVTDSIPLSQIPSLPSMPVDFLNSSDDSEGEYFCAGHDHLEKMYLDEVFNINIDIVFACLFTDSPFFRSFVGSRKTFELNLPNWEEEPDENGNKVRNITYTLTLNNSIGPRTSPSTERQICYTMSKPGKIYHVDCECCNGGIPYADSFYMLLRYCLTRVSPTKCRIVVTGELKYRKHVMGMFRAMIEKSAVNGLTDYYRQLSAHLRREAERQEAIILGNQTALPKKKLRRKRVKLHPTASDTGCSTRQQFSERQTSTPPSPTKTGYREDKLIELNAHTLVRIIIVILVLLLLFNAVLFYKLWSLESYASTLYGLPSQEFLENIAKQPRSQEEWSNLLQQQKMLHENEITKWEEVLTTSIHIVEQMKNSLVNLQATLRVGSHKES